MKDMTPHPKPRFSVLMSNYNKEEYIGEAIRSIINQTFIDWELLIVDDASTDKSLVVIEEFLTDYRIRLIKHGHRLGAIKVYNKLFLSAGCEIVGIVDSDDTITPDAIEHMYNAHILNTEAGYIDSRLCYCDQYLKPISESMTSPTHLKEPILFRRGYSHFNTFKLSAYFKTTGFDDRLYVAEDDDIVYKMEEVAPIGRVDKPLYNFRLLSDSLSNVPRRYTIRQRNLIFAKYLAYNRRKGTDITNLPAHHMLLLLAGAIVYCEELREYYKGVVFAIRAIRISPLRLVSWRIFVNSLITLKKYYAKSSICRIVFPIHQFQCQTGNILEDRIICLPLRHNPGQSLFGPDYQILTDGKYRLIFDMKIDQGFNDIDSLVAIDCYDNMVTKKVLVSSSISKATINKSNLYILEFNALMRQRLEFRVWWHGQCRLQIKRVFLEFL